MMPRNESVPAKSAVRTHRFTLLETVIAVLMLAGLVASVFVSASAIAASWERLNAEKDRFRELLALDRTLDSLLSNAVPFVWGVETEDYLERPAFTGLPEELGFVSQGQIHSFADGGFLFVHLAVRDDRLMAYYQSRPTVYPEQPETAAKASVLAENVERISFQYADMTEDGVVEWLDEWDAAEERLEIPLAIVVRVFWQDGREEAWLRRTAGSSQFERYGKWNPERRI
jgi:hypothetical protein